MRWLDYPFYRLTACFVLGILVARFSLFPLDQWLLGAAAFMMISFIFYFIKPFNTICKVLFTSAVLLFFIALGGLVMTLKSDTLPSNHFIHTAIKNEDALITIQLREQLSSNTFNKRFYADVTSINNTSTIGKVLVLFKQTDQIEYTTGDQLIVYDDINDASDARNPGDFNYKEYLKSIDVYGQIYIDKPRILSATAKNASLPWYVELKNKLLSDLEKSNLTRDARSLVEALVLGQRQNVDPTITQNFRDAGVIHILALSGLHVGIILLILQFSLSWLRRFKYGLWIQTSIVIILLWCFAFLTGLSPSILRAVTMFSFVALGMNLKRNSSVFFSLTISAFCLLFYDPRLLFQVGFQLSYTAVLAIVLLQPLFARLLPRIKYWLPRKLWQILTVTLAAQIGVAPLSVHYFHQLPIAFLIGNLALLLFLPVILAAAILFILMMEIGIPNDWLGAGLNYVFDVIISFIAYISSFKSFVWTDIHLKYYEVILMYSILIAIVVFASPLVLQSSRERFKRLRTNNGFHIALACFIVLIALAAFIDRKENNSFLVLHQSRGSAIAVANADTSILFAHFPSMDASRRENSLSRLNQLELFRETNQSIDSLPAQINYLDCKVVIIDESTAYIKSDVENPILLLSHSPKINLDRVITILHPKLIITDGSNYRNVVDRWRKTCVERNVPFINTYDDGAIDLLKY